MTEDEYIANLLCKATKDVLLEKNKKWLQEKGSPILKLSIGSGKRTYHMRERHGVHLIRYGKKMVKSKRSSHLENEGWGTSREIKKRGYYNGKVSLHNTLAAVVCHEYAHFIQNLNKKRYYGSVHNDYFYKILDKMHSSGVADQVKDYLMEDPVFRGLKYEKNIKQTSVLENPKSVYYTGQKVFFKDSGGNNKAVKVTRVNKKTLSATDGFYKYRIPYHLIVSTI